MKTDLIVDVSGSTNDHEILTYQKTLYNNFISVDKNHDYQTITFSDSAHVCTSLDHISRGYGCTYPNLVVSHLRNDAKTIVFFTDGQIGESEMSNFGNQWKGIEYTSSCKVIVVLSLGTLPPTTLDDIGVVRHINFSIPQVICSLFDHVLILFSIQDVLHQYDAKGIFSISPSSNNNNNNTTFIHDLPKVTWDLLLPMINTPTLPSNELVLTSSITISFDDLYNEQVEFSDEIWYALAHRSVLAKLNYKQLKTKLAKLLSPRDSVYYNGVGLNTNQIVSLSMKSDKTPEEEEIVKQWRSFIKTEKRDRKPMLACLNAITEYQNMGLHFSVLGSNRARGADTCVEPTSEEMDAHSLHSECPIMMEKDIMGIMLRSPSEEELKRFTSDECMEQPFMFGTLLQQLVTPGFFGYTVSTQIRLNPYTREPVAHFLPLVSDPDLVMRICSTLWGSSRVQWHMVRGYISLLSHISHQCEWAHDWKLPLQTVVTELARVYQVTKDLKGGSQRVPLYNSLQYVFQNTTACLRTRTKEDVQALMVVYDTIFDKNPIAESTKQSIGYLLDLMDYIRTLRLEKDVTHFIMEVDELGHYVASKTDLQAIVARFLWTITDRHTLSPTTIIDLILNHIYYGPIIKSYVVNGLLDKESLTPISLPEPVGIHFGEEQFPEKWATHCVYCNLAFDTVTTRDQHLRKELGNHFYRGYKAVAIIVDKFGSDTPIEILFKETKDLLFRWYGIDAPFLHTKRCRTRILELIHRAITI